MRTAWWTASFSCRSAAVAGPATHRGCKSEPLYSRTSLSSTGVGSAWGSDSSTVETLKHQSNCRRPNTEAEETFQSRCVQGLMRFGYFTLYTYTVKFKYVSNEAFLLLFFTCGIPHPCPPHKAGITPGPQNIVLIECYWLISGKSFNLLKLTLTTTVLSFLFNLLQIFVQF